MKRDFTVTGREAVSGHTMLSKTIKVTATNYANDEIEFMISANDEEQFQVYDMITVEVTKR